MRIRIKDTIAVKAQDVGKEVQISNVNQKGNTIACGYVVYSNGIIQPCAEDITKYRTEIVDGEKTQVEILPEIEGVPA